MHSRHARAFPIFCSATLDLQFADALKLPRFETGGVTYLKRLTMIVRDGVIYRTSIPFRPRAPRARTVKVAQANSRLMASKTERNIAVVSRPVFVL